MFMGTVLCCFSPLAGWLVSKLGIPIWMDIRAQTDMWLVGACALSRETQCVLSVLNFGPLE